MIDWCRILAGRFVVFDGPDGSGKSTQLRRFAELISAAGMPPVEVREPGGTPIGEAIRGVLLDPRYEEMELRCEMLLYMASRSQLMTERIRPALEARRFVLADRFISSTLAYQGTAGGLDPEEIREDQLDAAELDRKCAQAGVPSHGTARQKLARLKNVGEFAQQRAAAKAAEAAAAAAEAAATASKPMLSVPFCFDFSGDRCCVQLCQSEKRNATRATPFRRYG